MSMVLEHSRHLEAFLTPDAIRKPSSWAAEEASARPAKGRPPALRAHAMDGELVSECWKARALPITHAPARLVQHVLPCRCHGGTDRPSGRESTREIAAATIYSIKQVKSNAKELVSGGSTRREGRKRDVLPMHTFGTIVLPASHPLSPLPLHSGAPTWPGAQCHLHRAHCDATRIARIMAKWRIFPD